MVELILLEHCSQSYVPRTRRNASLGHVTAAFALDFTTAGERLTKQAAGPKYFGIPPDMVDPAGRLVNFMLERRHGGPVILNIAGNGIGTFANFGWHQTDVNQALYSVLKRVNKLYALEKIISGGQTGADVAGLVAAVALGIPAEGCLPKGFRQRGRNGKDYYPSEDQVRTSILKYAEALA